MAFAMSKLSDVFLVGTTTDPPPFPGMGGIGGTGRLIDDEETLEEETLDAGFESFTASAWSGIMGNLLSIDCTLFRPPLDLVMMDTLSQDPSNN